MAHGNTGNQNARKYTCNESIFSSDHPDIPYWLGWLITDGCILDKHGPQVSLELHKKDKLIIQEFSKFLNYTGKIYYKVSPKTNMCGISINSSKLVDDLINKFNITPRKTYNAKINKDLEFNNLFWRGAIEGDGSVFFIDDKININFISASEEFIEQYAAYCYSIIKTNRKIATNEYGTYYLTFSNYLALDIIKKIYKDNGPKLARKYDLVKNLILKDSIYSKDM